MSNLRSQLRDYYDARKLSAEKAEAILARGRAVASGRETRATGEITEFPVSLWRRRRYSIALAAALLLFAGIGVWREARDSTRVPFAALAPRLMEFLESRPKLTKAPRDKEELRAMLIAEGAPPDFHIPAKLMPLESAMCDVVNVDGRKTYLACFWREQRPDRGFNELVHLLVGRRGDFRSAPSSNRPELREIDGWSFASWTEGDVVYTLATPAPPDKLTPFLAGVEIDPVLAVAY